MTLSSIRTGPSPRTNNVSTRGNPIAADTTSSTQRVEAFGCPLRVMAYCSNKPTANEVQDYARHLAGLLDISFSEVQIITRENPTCNDLVKQVASRADLIIVEQLNQSLVRKVLLGSEECRAITQIPASFLFARQPHWPLKRILLVTRGQARDEPAVDWLLRLAQPSGAFVTVLALQPYLYCRSSCPC